MPHEQRYSANFKSNKPGLLSNSIGFYGGNYGDRNACFVNQNSLSLNIGGGTFNQSTKSKEGFMSKTMGNEHLKRNSNLGSMKSKSTIDKLGNIKKNGPIKATISTEKVRMSKYEHLSNKYVKSQKIDRPSSREKRPHSSTFVNTQNKEMDMYSKPSATVTKAKVSKECNKKKVNKRVRSASPGGLKNYLTQKHNSQGKSKPQRIIGGHLYHASMNG